MESSYGKKVHWPSTQALCSSCCAYYLYFYRLALYSPSKGVSDWQFSAILFECMASLIIALSRCSAMAVPKQQDMACDKGVSKLPATCNCHPHVGKVIPAEGLVLTD